VEYITQNTQTVFLDSFCHDGSNIFSYETESTLMAMKIFSGEKGITNKHLLANEHLLGRYDFF